MKRETISLVMLKRRAVNIGKGGTGSKGLDETCPVSGKPKHPPLLDCQPQSAWIPAEGIR